MSGGGQKAPQGYQPTAQPWADQGYQGAISQLGQIGTNLQSQVIPGYSAVTSAVQNNPYYQVAQSGADNAAGYAMNTLAPMQSQGAQSLYGAAGQSGAMASNIMAMQPGMANAYSTSASPYATSASPYSTSAADYSKVNGQLSGALPAATAGFGLAPGAYDTAMSRIPQYTQGAGLAPAVLGGTMNMMGQTTGGSQYADPLLAGSVMRGGQGYDAAMGMLPGATAGLGYGAQVMDTAFDPQKALYDRLYQQTTEHQNAINAQNGVAGSPFAAGLTGDAARGLDIDWQNQQLQRQIAGLGAWDQAASTAAGNASSLIGAGSNAWNSGVNAGVGAYTGLTSNAANNYANLQNSGIGAYDALMSGDVSRLATLQGSGTDAFNSLTNGAANNLTSIEGLISQNIGAGFNSQLAANGQNFSQQLAANGQNFNQQLGANGQNFSQGQQALNSGVNNYAALSALGMNQMYGASDLGSTALNNYYSGSQLPNQTYLGQQQANINALNAQTAGTNASASLTQQSAEDYNNYLKTGQSATTNAQNAAKINNDASAANMAGIGKLVGTVAGIALAPFTGGASLAMVGAAQGMGKGGMAGASDLAMTA
jgi:hypothetical protein